MPNLSEADARKLRATDQQALERLKKKGESRERPKAWIVVPDLEDPAGEPLTAFQVQMLFERELNALMAKHRPPVDPDTGQATRDFDWARYRLELIHQSTVPEDRVALWDNPSIREAWGVQSNLQLIEKMLGGAGLVAAICLRIDRLSGAGLELPSVDKLTTELGNASGPEASSSPSTGSTSDPG